jgi:hypothetical protein
VQKRDAKPALRDLLHATERDQERVQAERRAYRGQLAQVRPEDLVFVDESGVNRGMARL